VIFKCPNLPDEGIFSLHTSTLQKKGKDTMRFYTKQHKYYCGIDLHTKSLRCCVVNNKNEELINKKLECDTAAFKRFISGYKKDVIVGVECIFSWYWIADFCAEIGVAFVLGHALYMKAIHGGKAKNDKIDARKIAFLLKGGNFPLAYTYPPGMRKIRDLLRRRATLVAHKSTYMAHIKIANYQYNLPHFKTGRLDSKCRMPEILDHFPDPVVKESIQIDLDLIRHYMVEIKRLEAKILALTKQHNSLALSILQSLPGAGKVLPLTLLYEIHDVNRFPSVQQFSSYGRLVKCTAESDGKIYGTQGAKIGNRYIKWAFSEMVYHAIAAHPKIKKFAERNIKKHGKGKAYSIIAHKLGRACFYMLKRKEVFDVDKLFK
jgi:transposase